jgi:hypothetical protein
VDFVYAKKRKDGMTSRDMIPAAADHVIGSFSRDTLSSALASMHRAGYGPQTRVIDGTRGNSVGQLERAGLSILNGDEPKPDDLLIVVMAPGRVARVVDLFARIGADEIRFAARKGTEASVLRPASEAAPDIRIGAGVEAPADA